MERHIIRHFTFVFALGYATAALGQQGDPLISRPRHSTLTLFAEAGFRGDRYVGKVSPPREKQMTRQVNEGDLSTARLRRRVSSARLACGQRDTDAYLFDSGLSGGLEGAWKGNVVQISCKAGETVTINLHEARGQPGNVSFGDRATKAFILVHAAKRRTVPLFSTVLGSQWSSQLPTLLPSAASADGDPELTLVDVDEFDLKQNLKIDAGVFCAQGSGWFKYRVRVAAPNSGYGHAQFFVTPWGNDAMGGLLCSDAYDNRLRDAVRSGAPQLEARLNAQAQNNSVFGEARTFYFSAQAHGHQFFLESDGSGPPEASPTIKP